MGADFGTGEYKKTSTIQKLGRDPVIAGCCCEPPREGAVFFRSHLDWIILEKIFFTYRDVGDW